jgi:hypothetical protein
LVLIVLIFLSLSLGTVNFFLYTISRSLIRRLSQIQNVEDVFSDFVVWYQAQFYLYLFR